MPCESGQSVLHTCTRGGAGGVGAVVSFLLGGGGPAVFFFFLPRFLTGFLLIVGCGLPVDSHRVAKEAA